MIRVVVADDEELIRGALVALLSLEPDIQVVADVADGESAVAAAVRHQPDIALLDLEMPVLDGADAARQLQRVSATHVIIVTRHARPGTLKRALAAGVRGFVPKSTPASELAKIIRRVAAGGRYIDASLATAALMEEENPLTQREADVLRLAREGMPTKQIGKELHIAHGTVRNHVSSAMSKLHAESKISASILAYERGWI